MAYKRPQINASSQKNYFQGGSENVKIQSQTTDYNQCCINVPSFEVGMEFKRIRHGLPHTLH